MKLLCLFALFALLPAATPAHGQASRSAAELEQVLVAAGRAVVERNPEGMSRRYVDLTAGCAQPERDMACSLDHPIAADSLAVLAQSFARGVARDVRQVSMSALTAARRENTARARSVSPTIACGDPTHDNAALAFVYKLQQASVSADTVRLIMSVTEIGRLFGCPAGMQLYQVEARRSGAGFELGTLTPGVHAQVMVERP